MAPKTLRHHSGIPKWMSLDDRQRFLSTFAIAVNPIRKKQTELRIRRQAQRVSILFDHLLVATWRAELCAAGCLSDARPEVPTYPESGWRDFRIEDDEIANYNRRDYQQH